MYIRLFVVSCLRETKSPDRDVSLLAPYKRRVVYGAQCGVGERRFTKSPEAGDSTEETNSVDGVIKDLICGFFSV